MYIQVNTKHKLFVSVGKLSQLRIHLSVVTYRCQLEFCCYSSVLCRAAIAPLLSIVTDYICTWMNHTRTEQLITPWATNDRSEHMQPGTWIFSSVSWLHWWIRGGEGTNKSEISSLTPSLMLWNLLELQKQAFHPGREGTLEGWRGTQLWESTPN